MPPATIFDGTPANPTEEAVLEAHAVYKQNGCDGIIGLGGGSALDLAKAVRLLTGHDGPLAQYTLVAGGVSRIHGRICPMIAIPTTSGTGSEVGRAAVIITAEGRKLGIISPHMLPSIALVRSRTDLWLARLPDGGHRHGCDVALPRNLHGAGFQSARRCHRHGRPDARLALAATLRSAMAATRRPATT